MTEKANLNNLVTTVPNSLKKNLRNARQRMIHCYQVTGEQCYILDMVFLEIENLQIFLDIVVKLFPPTMKYT